MESLKQMDNEVERHAKEEPDGNGCNTMRGKLEMKRTNATWTGNRDLRNANTMNLTTDRHDPVNDGWRQRNCKMPPHSPDYEGATYYRRKLEVQMQSGKGSQTHKTHVSVIPLWGAPMGWFGDDIQKCWI